MRVLYEQCAAVDLGKDLIAVAIRMPGDGPDSRLLPWPGQSRAPGQPRSSASARARSIAWSSGAAAPAARSSQ